MRGDARETTSCRFDCSRKAMISTYWSLVKESGASAGIVERMRSNRSATLRPFQLTMKLSPAKAGAIPLPLRSSAWHAAQA